MGPVAEADREVFFAFRPMGRHDFPAMQRWLAAPHVAVWWNEANDPASLEARYGPRIDGREPVFVYVVEFPGVAIGWIQWYRWRDFAAHGDRLGAGDKSAGIDLAIGELEMTGRGFGPEIIREFGTRYIFVNSDVDSIVADPAVSNLHSVSAFRKAGFISAGTVQLAREDFERQVIRLDADCCSAGTGGGSAAGGAVELCDGGKRGAAA